MNTPLIAETLADPELIDPLSLPLAAEGVQRRARRSALGPILMEAYGGVAFVNGRRVVSMVGRHESETGSG